MLCQSVDMPDGGQACPASDTAAQGTSCTYSGQQCFYPGVACPPPYPNTGTDVCQCSGNFTGDAGLSWQCDLNDCP